MGTHPIFESDFDCLTEWLIESTLPKSWRLMLLARRTLSMNFKLMVRKNFLFEQKVLGSVKNVAKKPKEDLIKAYEKMYEEGAFKGSEADVELVKKVAEVKVTKVEKDEGPPKFKKRIIKKSPNADSRRPNKGEKIGCYYIGRLDGPDGKIFDQLQPQ